MHPELLRTGILTALQSGLRFAGAYLLDGDEVLSAESWHPDEISVDERDRLLQLLTSGAEFTDAELHRHLGSPPIPADRRTHLVLVDALQTHFPHAYVVGEEASDKEWDLAEGAPEDSLIFQVDAIDGSLPYDTLTFGFSVNLLAYRRGPKEDELLFAALVNSSGFLATFQEGSGVTIGTFKSQQRVTEPLSQDFRTDSIAALGALPRHRRLIEAILRDDSLTVFTAAGAPAALGLIIGRLGVLVATKSQTTHDAVFLPILAALGVPILVEGGLVLGLEDVRRLFAHVARSQEDRRAHPIPRFVLARDPIFGAAIARLLFSDGTQ